MARVRINVRTDGTTIVREGTGFGSAYAATPSAAYEREIKAAETDAIKRAFMTFGNRFGLCLYDKEQRGVEDGEGLTRHSRTQPVNCSKLFGPDGTMLAGSLSAEGFCSGLRQLIEACKKAEDIDALRKFNAEELDGLRARFPSLCNRGGVHYADLLATLMEKRKDKFPAVLAKPLALSNLSDVMDFAPEESAAVGAVSNPTFKSD